jgi:hypothetical protein
MTLTASLETVFLVSFHPLSRRARGGQARSSPVEEDLRCEKLGVDGFRMSVNVTLPFEPWLAKRSCRMSCWKDPNRSDAHAHRICRVETERIDADAEEVTHAHGYGSLLDRRESGGRQENTLLMHEVGQDRGRERCPFFVLRELGALLGAMCEVVISPDEYHRIERARLLGPAADELGVANDGAEPVFLIDPQKLGRFAGLDLIGAHLKDHAVLAGLNDVDGCRFGAEAGIISSLDDIVQPFRRSRR